jgi:hypothetical protein
MSTSEHARKRYEIVKVIQVSEVAVRLVAIPLALTAVILTALVWKSERDLMLFLITVSSSLFAQPVNVANVSPIKGVPLNPLQRNRRHLQHFRPPTWNVRYRKLQSSTTLARYN